jgi:hypothetical protein
MESEWSGPQIHSAEYVRTWKSDRWGILCHTKPTIPGGGQSDYAEDETAKIERAIADRLAYKAEGFRGEKS